MKRLLGNSAVYGLGTVLQKFLGLLVLPFFTRALTPAEYGIIALLTLFSTAISGFFNLGTGNSLGILYFKESEQSRRHTIVWTNVLLLAVNVLVLFVILYVSAPFLSRLIFETESNATYLRIALATLGFMTVTEPFYAWLRMEERAKKYVLLTFIGTLSTLGLSILFVIVMEWGILGYLLGGAVGTMSICGIVVWSVGKELKFGIDTRYFKPLVRIGFPSIFGLLAFLLIDYADRQMLQRMAGLDELGIYSIGYSFGMMMLVFVGAFGAAWPPYFMTYVNKRNEASRTFGKILFLYVAGFGLIALLFFAAARPMVTLLAAPAYWEAYKVVGLVAAAYLFKGVYLILLPGIYFAEKLWWQSAIEWCTALINVALNYILIPKCGMVGAALATLGSYMVLALLAWGVSVRYLALDVEWKRLAVVASLYIFSGGLLSYLAYTEPFWRAVWETLLVMSTVTAGLYFVIRDEIHDLVNSIRGKREKIQ